MNKLKIINIEYNSWNGFILSVIGIELNRFEGDLIGLQFSKDYLIFYLLFYQFTIKSPFYEKETQILLR